MAAGDLTAALALPRSVRKVWIVAGFSFRALGFDVQVQPGFWILAAIFLVFGLQRQNPIVVIAGAVAVVFASILVHELGHAVVARQFRMKVHGVFIHGFGGHVLHSPGPARQQLLVSLAGPGAGLALGLPLLALWLSAVSLPPLVEHLLFYAVFVNVIWSLFNLLPMLPLDGGNALASLLELRMGRASGRARAAQVGIFTAVAVAGLALYANETWILLIGGFCAYTSYQTWIQFRR